MVHVSNRDDYGFLKYDDRGLIDILRIPCFNGFVQPLSEVFSNRMIIRFLKRCNRG
jgi:hypothetical protein